ncbi:hypothetical protein QBC46DRAFT_274401, partial [Diplogelasinospora grovesii]
CFVDAITHSACALDDAPCLCGLGQKPALTECLVKGCTIRQLLTTQNVTSTLCGVNPVVDGWSANVVVVFLILTGIAVILRIWGRLLSAKLWWEDFNTLIMSLLTKDAHYVARDVGMGKNLWAVPFDSITNFLTRVYAMLHVYIIARLLSRTAILLFYLRVFQDVAKRTIIITLLFILAHDVSSTIIFLCVCRPLNFFWDRWDGEHEGRCIDLSAVMWALCAIPISLDVWIALLPIPLLAKLNLPLKKKVAAASMFALGLTPPPSYVRADRCTVTNRRCHSVDMIPLGIVSALEINLTIITACMPGIASLYKILKARYFEKRSQKALTGPTAHQTSWPRDLATGKSKKSGKIYVTNLTEISTVYDSEAPPLGSYYPLGDVEPCAKEQRPASAMLKV